MCIRSLETLPATLRARRIKGMQEQAAARLARNTARKGGKRVTFPHGGKVQDQA